MCTLKKIWPLLCHLVLLCYITESYINFYLPQQGSSYRVLMKVKRDNINKAFQHKTQHKIPAILYYKWEFIIIIIFPFTLFTIHIILKMHFIYSQPNQLDVHSLILCYILSDKILTIFPHINLRSTTLFSLFHLNPH